MNVLHAGPALHWIAIAIVTFASFALGAVRFTAPFGKA